MNGHTDTSPAAAEKDLLGTPLGFKNPDPWDEIVDGADLLNQISRFIRRFAVITSQAADAVAAWIVAGYAVGIFAIAPILLIRSPTKRCGKTRLLEILELLVRQPISTVNASAAALYRIIEIATPTVLIDEAEVLAGRTERAQQIREILNAGYRRGPRVIRCTGDNYNVSSFDVFGYKAIAAIGRLWDTLEDRSIHIELRRRMSHEKIDRFRRRNVEPEAQVFGRKAVRWVQDHVADLGDTAPVLPEFLDDRAQDLWEPLFAIGKVAGDGWYERLVKAAHLLSASRTEDLSEAIQLLADVRVVWTESDQSRLPTTELLQQLYSMEDRPWAEVLKTAKRFAELLKPYDIRPRTWRFGVRILHGYERSQFEDAFRRYLPSEPQQAQHSSNDGGIPVLTNRNTVAAVAVAESGEKPPCDSNVADVALPRPQGSVRHYPAWLVDGRSPPSGGGNGEQK